VERTAVKVFYGSFPPSSLKESIVAFEKTRAMAPGFILNCLELSKAYHRNNQNDKAIALLNQLLLYPDHTEDDPALKTTARKFLQEWQ
jgi:thioredoxin-like negative regulator of GroEL